MACSSPAKVYIRMQRITPILNLCSSAIASGSCRSRYSPALALAHKTTRHRWSHSLSTMSADARNKLEALRALMQRKEVDVYVVPTEDAHASEFLAECDTRRAWLTAFTGSAGCAVVTQNEARCWADGRYFLQAGKQLSSDWTLMKQGLPGVPTVFKWVEEELKPGAKVAIDPTVMSFDQYKTVSKALAEMKPTPSTLMGLTENLVDQVWTDRPARPANPVFFLEDKYSGEKVFSKVASLREKMKRIGTPGMVVSALDEVAWLFNLRGSDIAFNPVFFAYAILTQDECTLFVNPASLSEDVRSYLHSNDVTILEYERVWGSLQALGKQAKEAAAAPPTTDVDMKEAAGEADKKDKEEKKPEEKLEKTNKVLIGKTTSWAVAKALGEDLVDTRRSLISDAKARKNATEIEGFRQCNIRDGAALVRYFAWLEDVLNKGEEWNEFSAAAVLEDYRSQGKLFKGLSFETISSAGPNAAVIHYSPTAENHAPIKKDQIYLCDSGAQYLDGTTDTTRTLHFGQPTDDEKRAFTRVLQGHIALDQAIFPPGTTGYMLDCLARRALWSDGLDYRHGTGHGVGSFLNVHEGPQGVGPRIAYNDVALQAGHVISNEPGYYEDGKFGIRIENVQVVRNANTKWTFGGKGYLEFEHFTMVPVQTKLIEASLLAPSEKQWINDYHNEVLEKVSPLLEEYQDDRALQWLKRECEAI